MQPLVKRLVRLAAVAVGGIVLGVTIYAALVRADVLRGPFDPVLSGDIELARSERPGLRVLFVGNSLTAGNSMPELVRELAAGHAGGDPIFAVQYAAGNWTLRQASRDSGLAALLREVDWDVVVLQENSRIASYPPGWSREMYPFARVLDREIRRAGARTVLFMTWGYKNGAPTAGHGETFDDMQALIAHGYLDLGAQLSAVTAPVGIAWVEAQRRRPGVDLWTDDGRHPSLAGSYLAAAVFYAVLSGRDPAASDFTAGLPTEEAAFLRFVASEVVDEHLQRPDRTAAVSG
jgi:hypothetical protein